MKRTLSIITGLLFVLTTATTLMAQSLKPTIEFEDEPRTHNVHITTDGFYYYTINAGLAYQGMISKFSLTGNFIESYDINLDMRSIMYNAKDKQFYICTYTRNIYRITDMQKGKYELVLGELYEDNQASLALSVNGKMMYYFSKGVLKIYQFPKGKLVKTISGFDRGSDFITGSSAVAVDEKHIYTWNTDYGILNVYDLKGNKEKSVTLSNGDYGPSLSFANGLIFVSTDGNYGIGHWYGYNIWAE